MNNYTQKVLKSIDENPELLNQLLNSENAPMTRGGERVNPLLNVVGNIDANDMRALTQELSANPVVQLYMASQGSLDARDLLQYTGGTTGTRAAGNQAVRALFDGRLDLKEIMLIIVLLKLFKRKNANTYNNSAIGLLGSLLGFNSGYGYSSGGNLFSSLLGGGGYQNGYGNGLFGGSYGNGLFGSSYNSNSALGNFLGLTGSNSINNSGLHNLMNFVNGSYNNNPQYQALYNILNSAAGSAVNSQGTVNANGLFSVLSQLMGY
ncbi:MAG: hypothetical protein IIY56_06425 [Erysipelotrichaceae bacterium]|nr:hypothetical protein [Erysipelotrichaceae bacterium]